jgi:hypothetical protein
MPTDLFEFAAVDGRKVVAAFDATSDTFAALNPGLAGALSLQRQQQADRDTCKDHPVHDPCPCRIFRFGPTDGEVRPGSARRAHALPSGRHAGSARPRPAIGAYEIRCNIVCRN